ncbi:MAG: hypothetical protein Q7T74_07385 [Candidatus Saccharibacteria bacterium]|nr:hypothetical protein [Candidatus Saccharibacteria bacterium]
MEPHSNNPENLANKSPEQGQESPELGVSPDQRKLEKVPIGALEQLGGDTSKERSGVVKDNPQVSTDDTVVTLPSIPVPAQDDSVSITTQQTPIVAADDDVIEKEWVNKAKKVISQTKGDPYTQEREVSKLQADYMQKRYGKQVKMPDET